MHDSEPFSSVRLSDDLRPLLARQIVQRHYQLHPELQDNQGAVDPAWMLDQADSQIRYLCEALAIGRNDLFAGYIAWARATWSARGVPERELLGLLDSLEQVVREHFPQPEAQRAKDIIAATQAGAGTPLPAASFLQDHNPQAELARDYLDALLALDRHRAGALIEAALDQGTSIGDIYLRVFQPVLWEVGRLWQENQLGVAYEHYISAATQATMSRLYPRIFSGRRHGRQLVMACAGDELHEIGARMVADLFELAGWDTIYLGANVEAGDLVALLARESPDLLGLSVTLGDRLGTVRELIRRVRREADCRQVKILLGGQPFNLLPELWRQLGADGYATNAAEAVAVAADLFPGSVDARG